MAIEYALLSAMVAVGIIASIFYLEANTVEFYADWGGEKSNKVTTKAMVDHYNGNSTGTVIGAPVKPIGSSNLMNSLSTYNAPLSIVSSNLKPKPQVMSQKKPGKLDKEEMKETLISKIEEIKKPKSLSNLEVKEEKKDKLTSKLVANESKVVMIEELTITEKPAKSDKKAEASVTLTAKKKEKK